MAAQKTEHVLIEVSGQELRVSNPGKLYFPQAGVSKLDLVHYYIECEEAVVRHLRFKPHVETHGNGHPHAASHTSSILH